MNENNSGLREAITKIEEMAQKENTQIFEIHGNQYSTEQLHMIKKEYFAPVRIEMNTLDSLVDVIKIELEKAFKPLFVRVASPTYVEAFTAYHDKEDYCNRDYLYKTTAELPDIHFNQFISHEDFMIALRSKFIETEDNNYLLNLLATITDKNSVESNDDGITQSLQVRKGVAMVQNVTTKPKVSLQPFRTFLEVEQPVSEFLLRLKEGGYIGLYEADGGAWKLEAKKSIKEYLLSKLAAEVESKEVVIIA